MRFVPRQHPKSTLISEIENLEQQYDMVGGILSRERSGKCLRERIDTD